MNNNTSPTKGGKIDKILIHVRRNITAIGKARPIVEYCT